MTTLQGLYRQTIGFSQEKPEKKILFQKVSELFAINSTEVIAFSRKN